MKTFAGFGFGPIQSALFLFEAYQSGHFSRYVVAEVDPTLVAAVRNNGGAYTINIARRDRIDQVTVKGVELYNPRETADRAKILAAIADADELATALPSISFYDSGEPSSVARMLAGGLSQRKTRKPTVLYAAENHNHAAEILTETLARHASPAILRNLQVLNTVIGKMSGVISEPEVMHRMGLAPMTPSTPRAILVEEFNRILVSRITLPDFQRGIDVFVEKDDLLPFEEAKLYGHNAIHALIGYLADLKGLSTMAMAADHPDILQIARSAFLEESGAALIRKHAGLGDPLFTQEGYRAYAEDLLERMVRPNLNDLVARVIRDHVRKLGYDDRLYGTMRVALQHGIEPANLAKGAAAAVLSLVTHRDTAKPPLPLPAPGKDLTEQSLATLLRSIWGNNVDAHADHLVQLTWTALADLRRRPHDTMASAQQEHLAAEDLLLAGRRVIADEAAGLKCLADTLDASFPNAVQLIQSLKGHLVVTGLGKSGLIARKVAATLTSTGTPATFMHPVEALHGDLGLVGPDDALLAFSKSGNTDELVRFLLHFRRLGGAVITVTANRCSRMAELATIVLPLPDLPEACPLNLAPTSSTSMMLSLGDALAMVLLEARGFKPEDFARSHPEGSLGKRLLLRARDIMHGGDELPVVRTSQSLEDLLRTIDQKAMGLACIVDEGGAFLGVFTDGDLRRLVRRCANPMSLSIEEAFQLSRRSTGDVPVSRSLVGPDLPLIDCRQIMRDSKITALVVADERSRPIGIVRQHDIVAVGLS